MTKVNNTYHRQVPTYNPIFGVSFEVDEGLVEILKLIWDLGLATEDSCQESRGKPGMVKITFILPYEAEQFVSLVFTNIEKKIDYDEETTYQRIIRHGCKKCWEFEIFPEYVGNVDDVKEIDYSATIFFPIDDLPKVVESLKKINIE